MTVDDITAAVSSWAVGERLIRRVYLFGSRARGDFGAESDIDLAVLHDIDPGVRASCDTDLAHWLTWEEFKEPWTLGVQSWLTLPVDVQQIDRESRGKVVPSLKQCRVCLYRRAGMRCHQPPVR